jgi:hypothetical protein
MMKWTKPVKTTLEKLTDQLTMVQQQIDWVNKNPGLPEKERMLADFEERKQQLLSQLKELSD